MNDAETAREAFDLHTIYIHIVLTPGREAKDTTCNNSGMMQQCPLHSGFEPSLPGLAYGVATYLATNH